jgi:hypothetical protein
VSARDAGQRRWLERLPAYALDLNPVDGIRPDLKHRELGAVCWYDQREPRPERRGAGARRRHRQDVRQGVSTKAHKSIDQQPVRRAVKDKPALALTQALLRSRRNRRKRL